MSDPLVFPHPENDFPNSPYAKYADTLSSCESTSPLFANAYELRTANLLNLIPHVEERDRNALIEEISKRVGLQNVVDRYEENIAKKQQSWDEEHTEIVFPDLGEED